MNGKTLSAQIMSRIVVALVATLLVGLVAHAAGGATATASPRNTHTAQASEVAVTKTENLSAPNPTTTNTDVGARSSTTTDTITLAGFDPWYGLRYSWSKTVNFAGCIFGVGVPIGLVWAFATNPALWRYILNMGPMPASYGSSAYNYMRWVKNRCAYAIR